MSLPSPRSMHRHTPVSIKVRRSCQTELVSNCTTASAV